MPLIESTRYFSAYKKHQTKIRFVVVGGWNTLFGYLMFVLFDMLFARIFHARYLAYMSANILSNVIAIINAYVFHKYVTFKSPEKGSFLIIEFLRFCLTYLGTFLLSLILLPVFVELLGLIPRLAASLVILACTLVSYIGHSKFSFRRRSASVHKTDCFSFGGKKHE